MIRISLFALLTGCIAPETPEALENDEVVDVGEGATPYALYNMEWRYETSGYDSTWWRSPTAYCSTGNVLFGMGAALPQNQSILFRGMHTTHVRGELYPNRVESAAHEDGAGTSVNWDVTAYAVCGRPLPGHFRKERRTGEFSTSTRVGIQKCPPNMVVVGMGGTIYGGDRRVKIDEIRSSVDGTQVEVFASEDQVGTTDNWGLFVDAVCAERPAGYQRVATVVPNATDGREVIASCPAGKKLLASGGGVQSTVVKYTRVFNIVPSVNLQYTIVRVGQGVTVPGSSNQVVAYAICADEVTP